MEKPNFYAQFIDNYDLNGLIEIARNQTFETQKKADLIEALETTLNYLDYEYACEKMSDIGPEYLEAIETLGHLKGEKDYLGVNRYYFNLIELRKSTTSAEKKTWFNLLEENINKGLASTPDNEALIASKLNYLRLLSEERGHTDSKIVQSLFDLIKSSAENFPKSDFWTIWLYEFIAFEKVKLPGVVQVIDQSIDEFIALSQSLYESKLLDPVVFYRQLGAYNFVDTLPEKIKSLVAFWIHKAIHSAGANLNMLSPDQLRQQGILFINGYVHYVQTDEVIKHTVALNTLSWQRSPNWNSLLFYLRAKKLHALHLKNAGNINECLNVFEEALIETERVRNCLDLYDRENFSFGSPLLEFYQEFVRITPSQEQRTRLTRIRLEVSHATIATAEGAHLFPFEHHLASAAYLSLPMEFERSWMQMCMVLCRYAHAIFQEWKDSHFVVQNDSLTELLEKSAFLFSETWEFNLHNYHKKYPVILHTLSDSELSAEFDRFLNYAKAHREKILTPPKE